MTPPLTPHPLQEMYNYNDINQLMGTLARDVHDLVDKVGSRRQQGQGGV